MHLTSSLFEELNTEICLLKNSVHLACEEKVQLISANQMTSITNGLISNHNLVLVKKNYFQTLFFVSKW